VIRWDPPGPYVVAFTTREGGVSEGPFASLNLGSEGDAAARVEKNRRRACDLLGLDASRLAVNRQLHSPAVHRARAGSTDEPGDGLWTDEPELPMLALTADCLPIAVAATGPGRPALAILHAGWRGLAEGVVEAGVGALGGARAAAVIGPAIGPCCYEVGPEVAGLFDADLVSDGRLDLPAAGERALRRAGVDRVERIDLCTRCNEELFFSHRRSGPVRGVQGVFGAVAG
jgi:YfiH family protein